MPSYPSQVIAALQTINGSSCGELAQLMDFKVDSNPPEYREVVGQGDFSYAQAKRYTLADSTVTWRLKLRYMGAGACMGLHEFQRVPNADDPTGVFHKLVSGVPTQSAGEAAVSEP